MKRSLFVGAVILVAGVAGSAHAALPQKTAERIVAVVNEDIILETELEQWAAPQVRGGIDLSSAQGRKAWDSERPKLLDQMIDSRLVEQQAGDLKLSVTPEEVDRAIEQVKTQNHLEDAQFSEALKQQGFTMESYRKNLRRQILQLKVLSVAVRSRVSVSDDEVRTYYQQNARQLAGDKMVHLREILIAVPSNASPEEVERRKNVAGRVVELARTGRSFQDLAKTYSDDATNKGDGGDTGWVGKGVLADSLEEVVASMDPGDVRGPIRTARGWQVLQLVERKQGDIKSFDQVKEQLRKTLYDQQVEKASQAWIRELRKKAHIDVRL